jgi:hypothetical protein
VYLTIAASAASTFTSRDRRKLKRTNRRNVRLQHKLSASRQRQHAAILQNTASLAAAHLRSARGAQRSATTVCAVTPTAPFRVTASCSHRQQVARREARPGHRAAASSCGGGSDDGDGDGGSDPPGEGNDEPFADDEARQVAAHVAELYPDGLTKTQFNVAVWPFLFGLDSDEVRDARQRIYAELPDRLRMAILGDVLTRASSRPSSGDDPPAPEVRCRCCAEPFEPLCDVDEDGICADCWDFPEDEREKRELVQVGPGTWAPPRADDPHLAGRPGRASQGGGA